MSCAAASVFILAAGDYSTRRGGDDDEGREGEGEVGQVVLSHKVGNVRGLGEELGDFSRVAICHSEKSDTLRHAENLFFAYVLICIK